MKYCVKCGAELPEGEVGFCPECGANMPPPRSASGGKGAAAASAPAESSAVSAAAPESAKPARVESSGSGQRPPRKRRVALWLSWSLVAVLAGGNIFLGLYFGLRDDGKATADSESTTTVAIATTTTLAAATTTSIVGEPGGGTAAALEDATAQMLVLSAMTAIASAYVDTGTFDPAVMTPAVLQSVEPSITFVATTGSEDTSAAAWAADREVFYLGNGSRFGVGTNSASGNSFAVVFDSSAGEGGSYTYYVNDRKQEW